MIGNKFSPLNGDEFNAFDCLSPLSSLLEEFLESVCCNNSSASGAVLCQSGLPHIRRSDTFGWFYQPQAS